MIYSVKRFSDDGEKKSGMGTLGKVALGAAAIGGGIMAGRAGLLGAGIQKGIGRGTAQLGKWAGSSTLARDGVRTYQKGGVKEGLNQLASGQKGGIQALSKSDNLLANQNATLDTKKMINDMGIGDLLKKKPVTPA